MLDPIAFTIFGLDIHWYGIMYSIGFLFGYIFLMHYSKYFKIEKDKLENIYLFVLIFSVISARLFEILVYNPAYYFSNPLKIFAVWQGGMSIHGGILGGILTLLYFSKKYKITFLKLTDIFVVPLSLALAFGRLANFINQELVGTPTNSSLGIIFPNYDNIKRWPYQIFASAQNIITFQILYYLQEFKKLKTGTITALFFILYNLGRFLIDFMREPTIDLGIISMGQLLSLIYAAAGIILYIKINSKYSS